MVQNSRFLDSRDSLDSSPYSRPSDTKINFYIFSFSGYPNGNRCIDISIGKHLDEPSGLRPFKPPKRGKRACLLPYLFENAQLHSARSRGRVQLNTLSTAYVKTSSCHRRAMSKAGIYTKHREKSIHTDPSNPRSKLYHPALYRPCPNSSRKREEARKKGTENSSELPNPGTANPRRYGIYL